MTSRSTPPGPRGLRLWAAGVRVARDPLRTIQGFVERYGDVVCVGKRLFWIVWRPEHVDQVLASGSAAYGKGEAVQPARSVFGDGLVLSDGELWKEERRLLQPAFRRHRLPGFLEALHSAIERLLDRWEGLDGATLDLHDGMLELFRDVMYRSLFGSVDASADRDLAEAQEVIERHIELRAWNPFQWTERVPTPHNLRFRRAMGRMEDELRRAVDARRRDPGDRGDVLSVLLAAQEGSRTLTDRQLRDEVVTLFFTGHSTTAAALAWTWAALAERPELQERVHEAFSAGDRGRDLPGRVFDEAVRIWPPGWITARTASRRDEIAGYEVVEGRVILIPTVVTHRHPEIWPDPERFDPERFLPENAAGRHPFAYYPFGGGPRRCLGADVARELAVETLRLVLERFRIRLADGAVVRPRTSTLLRPRDGVPVVLERRR